MSVYAIMMLGSCGIIRRLREIENIWNLLGDIDVTAHELWREYESLLDSLWCIADGMEKMCA